MMLRPKRARTTVKADIEMANVLAADEPLGSRLDGVARVRSNWPAS